MRLAACGSSISRCRQASLWARLDSGVTSVTVACPSVATTRHGVTGGGQGPVKRYSVKEAAQVLGVGTDAIRKRVQRDTITHERVDGTVYVWLDEDEPQHDIGVTDDLIEAYKDQLETYKDQVDHLRHELNVRNEELRRKDTIIMTMARRIPELEPAS